MCRLGRVRYCARTTKIGNRFLLPLLPKHILIKTVPDVEWKGLVEGCGSAASNIQVLVLQQWWISESVFLWSKNA